MGNNVVLVYDDSSDIAIAIDYDSIIISLEYTEDFYELDTDITIII